MRAVGDTIALSVTPEYLKQIELIQRCSRLREILISCWNRRWRGGIFTLGWTMINGGGTYFGTVKPGVQTRRGGSEVKSSGVAPPVARSEALLIGAKGDVPGNVPTCVIFWRELQVQFSGTVPAQAGIHGPLHRARLNKIWGKRLNDELAVGQRKAVAGGARDRTGEKEMDASAWRD